MQSPPSAHPAIAEPLVGTVRQWDGAAAADIVSAGDGEVEFEHHEVLLQRWCTPLHVRMAGETRWRRFLPEARLWLPGDEQRNVWRGSTRNQFVLLTRPYIEAVLQRPYHTTRLAQWRGHHFDTPALVSLLSTLATDARSAVTPLLAEGLLAELTGWLADGPAAGAPATRSARLTPARLTALKDYIEAHLAEPLSLARLAAVAGCSPRLLGAAFKAGTGRSPHQYVLERRVSEAQLLLLQHCGLSEVAQRLGFADQSQFSNTFRRLTTMTPGEFRRLRGARVMPSTSMA